MIEACIDTDLSIYSFQVDDSILFVRSSAIKDLSPLVPLFESGFRVLPAQVSMQPRGLRMCFLHVQTIKRRTSS